jgi:uncharacterized BrkB/YihY/UPF0761 family membrane protein
VADYGSVFGSLASAIVLLTYLYLSTGAFLLGAQLDAAVRAQSVGPEDEQDPDGRQEQDEQEQQEEDEDGGQEESQDGGPPERETSEPRGGVVR